MEEVNGAGQQDPQAQQAPAEAAGHSGTEYAAQDNVDLTGNWAQKDMEGSDSFVAGYISDGVVEIFLMSEKGSKGSLYWSGTYVPQTTPGTPYTWDSVNDRDRTGQAEIGSDSDTKTFSYENGELTLPVTMLGQTTVVTMVRSTQDYSVFAGNGGASFSSEEGQPVEIEDRVFTWFTMDDGTCLIYYEMTLKNPNPASAIRNAVIQVTARGENESDLSTQERTVPMIAAGDTIMFGDAFSYQGPAPASVEMVAFNEPDAYVSQEASSAPSQSDLEVSNGLENVNETGTVYTGEVTTTPAKTWEMSASASSSVRVMTLSAAWAISSPHLPTARPNPLRSWRAMPSRSMIPSRSSPMTGILRPQERARSRSLRPAFRPGGSRSRRTAPACSPPPARGTVKTISGKQF